MSGHTKELIRELDAIRGSAKLCPSGAQGQTIGQETWRITLSGNSLQSITDAADKLNELEQQRDKLLVALEGLTNDIQSLTDESDGVACVNACAGIPTDVLEAMPSGPASLLPKLSDERILEIWASNSGRPVTMGKARIIAQARAIERELLGENNDTI